MGVGSVIAPKLLELFELLLKQPGAECFNSIGDMYSSSAIEVRAHLPSRRVGCHICAPSQLAPRGECLLLSTIDGPSLPARWQPDRHSPSSLQPHRAPKSKKKNCKSHLV